MTDVNRKPKSTAPDITGKNWADLCDSSLSSQSDTESPLKREAASAKDDDELYDLVFKPIKKENVKTVSQDDLSLTSFMNNVHMVTPIKQEVVDDDQLSRPNIVDEDTICSPFIKEEPIDVLDVKQEPVEESPVQQVWNNGLSHAKRRLTSECGPTVSDPVTPERASKFNKKSSEHRNIHSDVESPKIKLERETDASILARRQKQIDFGKNTIGYEKYLEQVPVHERKKEHPKTPPKNLKYTRRAWDGLVKNWRVRLHCWDPEYKHEDDDNLTTGSSSNLYSLGSMTSLDSSSQASDSRPSTPPSTKRPSEDLTHHNKIKLETVSSPNPVKFKKTKTENN